MYVQSRIQLSLSRARRSDLTPYGLVLRPLLPHTAIFSRQGRKFEMLFLTLSWGKSTFQTTATDATNNKDLDLHTTWQP
jgi:hypothetical protein